jgi:DNA polymerase-3 subunit delta
VTLDQLIERARSGQFPTVTVIGGSERLLVERAVDALKAAALGDDVMGFNCDLFQGAGLSAHTLINAARTIPMMAKSRFVLVRSVDAMASAELDSLCAYMRKPSPEACVVLVSEKLDGRSKLAKTAIELGCWFEAAPPKPFEIPELARREAERRGHTLSFESAQALADALGTDLSALDDALERLSLYVGSGRPIELGDVESCVVHARTESVWALVDAVGTRDVRVAIASAASLLGNQEPPLRILALVARQLRMLARMRSALRAGLKPQEAAVKAGAPPFKARELVAMAKRFDEAQLTRAFRTIAEADLALKGSKVPGPQVLERALLSLCR